MSKNCIHVEQRTLIRKFIPEALFIVKKFNRTINTIKL